MPAGDPKFDNSVQARWWLELNSAWAVKGVGRLSPEAEAYFRNMAVVYFKRALETARGIAGQRYGMPDQTEVWAVVMRSFWEDRQRSGRALLDDLSLRAFARAREVGREAAELADLIPFLRKYFELRVRDIMRVWVRDQFGTPSEQILKESIDKESSHEPGGSGRNLHEQITLTMV